MPLAQPRRVLAPLNHPHIAAFYGLEEDAKGDCLVLERVEGDQLHGPLPVRAAIDSRTSVVATPMLNIRSEDLYACCRELSEIGIQISDRA